MYQGRGSRGRDQVLRKFPGPVRRHVWKLTQVATWAMKRMRGDCVEPGLKKGGGVEALCPGNSQKEQREPRKE